MLMGLKNGKHLIFIPSIYKLRNIIFYGIRIDNIYPIFRLISYLFIFNILYTVSHEKELTCGLSNNISLLRNFFLNMETT